MSEGAVVLDCEGFAKLISRDPRVLALIKEANDRNLRITCSAATLIEARHNRIKPQQFAYARSRVVVASATEEIATLASDLLSAAGLHGHQHAIDAMVAATALMQSGPVTMLTSDPEDMRRLCGDRVEILLA